MIVFRDNASGRARIFYVDRMDIEELEATTAYYEMLGYEVDSRNLHKFDRSIYA